MHLQASIEDFDVFARSLSIGAETMVMRFDPDRPLHDRYRVEHGFLSPSVGREVVQIGRLVNAFFRWEFNSCETLIKGEEVHPIDFANACPDMSLISLHYYFPWAIKALAKWAIYCTVTERRMPIDQDTRTYFDIADRLDMTYGERIEEYGRLADEYFEIDAYQEFCDEHLGEIDEVMVDFVDGAEFDRLLIETVRATFPRSEQDQFIAHYRGLLNGWAHDQRSLSSPDSPA